MIDTSPLPTERATQRRPWVVAAVIIGAIVLLLTVGTIGLIPGSSHGYASTAGPVLDPGPPIDLSAVQYTTVTKKICGASCAIWSATITESFGHDGTATCVRGGRCEGWVSCSTGGFVASVDITWCGTFDNTASAAGDIQAGMDITVHGVFAESDFSLRVDNHPDGTVTAQGGAG